MLSWSAWVYMRRVTALSLCPKAFDTLAMSAPFVMAMLAKVCRSLWGGADRGRRTVPKTFSSTGKALGVHWPRAGLLGKDIGTDRFLGLLHSKLAQQGKCAFSHIHGAKVAVLWGIQIDTLGLGVAEVPPNGDGAGGKVNGFSLEGAALAPANACVDQQVNQGAPFQRLPLQAGNNFLHPCRSIGQGTVCLPFRLNVQEQGCNLGRGDFRELEVAQGRVDFLSK